MISGIYKIINIVNDKVYIGSTVRLSYRWWLHLHKLRKNKHDNVHLQSSWNKYGECNFKFEVIEYCEKELLIEREQFWIDLYNCNDRKIGYNKRLVAESNLGFKWDRPKVVSEETKKKISLSNKGRVISQYTRLKISEANKARVGVKYNKSNTMWKCEDKRKCKCEKCRLQRNKIGNFYKKRRKLLIKTALESIVCVYYKLD